MHGEDTARCYLGLSDFGNAQISFVYDWRGDFMLARMSDVEMGRDDRTSIYECAPDFFYQADHCFGDPAPGARAGAPDLAVQSEIHLSPDDHASGSR